MATETPVTAKIDSDPSHIDGWIDLALQAAEQNGLSAEASKQIEIIRRRLIADDDPLKATVSPATQIREFISEREQLISAFNFILPKNRIPLSPYLDGQKNQFGFEETADVAGVISIRDEIVGNMNKTGIELVESLKKEPEAMLAFRSIVTELAMESFITVFTEAVAEGDAATFNYMDLAVEYYNSALETLLGKQVSEYAIHPEYPNRDSKDSSIEYCLLQIEAMKIIAHQQFIDGKTLIKTRDGNDTVERFTAFKPRNYNVGVTAIDDFIDEVAEVSREELGSNWYLEISDQLKIAQNAIAIGITMATSPVANNTELRSSISRTIALVDAAFGQLGEVYSIILKADYIRNLINATYVLGRSLAEDYLPAEEAKAINEITASMTNDMARLLLENALKRLADQKDVEPLVPAFEPEAESTERLQGLIEDRIFNTFMGGDRNLREAREIVASEKGGLTMRRQDAELDKAIQHVKMLSSAFIDTPKGRNDALLKYIGEELGLSDEELLEKINRVQALKVAANSIIDPRKNSVKQFALLEKPPIMSPEKRKINPITTIMVDGIAFFSMPPAPSEEHFIRLITKMKNEIAALM